MSTDQAANTITPVTRKEIIDFLCADGGWAGDLNEHEFLSRLYDLSKLPSTDRRPEYNADASADIYQHRVNNSDWGGPEWLFKDRRFNIRNASDEQFLNFLCETVHPLVRSEAGSVSKMVSVYNDFLAVDGWELTPEKFISKKPIYSYRLVSDVTKVNLDGVKTVAEKLGDYVSNQVRRLEQAVEADPELAIGTAKEFLETLCKRILIERGVPVAKDEDFPALVKTAVSSLDIVPAGVVPGAEKAITILTKNLSAVSHQLAELRNAYGTGHGKLSDHIGLEKRHAQLAVGAATTLAVFLFASHESTPTLRADR